MLTTPTNLSCPYTYAKGFDLGLPLMTLHLFKNKLDNMGLDKMGLTEMVKPNWALEKVGLFKKVIDIMTR